MNAIGRGTAWGKVSNFELDTDKFQGPAKKDEACAWVRRPLKFAGQLERKRLSCSGNEPMIGFHS
jgi:hypothetical protein